MSFETFTATKIQKFLSSQVLLCPFAVCLPYPRCPATTDLLPATTIFVFHSCCHNFCFLFLEFHMIRPIKCVVFCIWLLCLSIMLWKFICVFPVSVVLIQEKHWVVFHRIETSKFNYLFTSRWKLGLFFIVLSKNTSTDFFFILIFMCDRDRVR